MLFNILKNFIFLFVLVMAVGAGGAAITWAGSHGPLVGGLVLLLVIATWMAIIQAWLDL